jgi:hypothetical protein
VNRSLSLNPPTYAPGGGILFQPALGQAGGFPTAPGGGGSSAPSFDVKGLLDSLLAPIRSDLAAQGQVDLAGRNAAVNRSLIQFGELPDFNQAQQALGLNLGEVIAPDTAQLAANNPYSATKQIAQHHTDVIQQIKRALAARGALQSGELGFQLNRENQAFGQQQYDARQKLLDMLGGIQQGYLAGQRAAQQALANAGNGALQTLLGLFPQGFPTGGNSGGQQSAPPPPGGGTPPPQAPRIGGDPQMALARALENYGPSAQQRAKFIGY